MQGSGRVLTVDLWRGFALVTIFINHVPGNALELVTHKNFGFSDASELFVLLAGMAAAFAYLPRFLAGSGALSTLRLVLRSMHLYVVHLAILVMAGAVVIAATLQMDDPRIAEAMQFDLFLSSPGPALIGFVTLAHQPSYLNILPLYVVLLLLAPLLMLAMRIHAGVALGASATLYVVTQMLDLRLPNYPLEGGGWYFNPLAWQFLFAIGIVTGARLAAGRPLAPPRWLAVVALAYIVGALVWTRSGWFLESGYGLPRFIWDFDKTNLSMPRLLHVLALVIVVSRLPMERWIGAQRSLQPLVLMGRQSLAVFGVGTVLAIIAQAVRIALGGAVILDMLMIVCGLLVQMAVAWALEWNKTGRTQPSAETQSAALARASG